MIPWQLRLSYLLLVFFFFTLFSFVGLSNIALVPWERCTVLMKKTVFESLFVWSLCSDKKMHWNCELSMRLKKIKIKFSGPIIQHSLCAWIIYRSGNFLLPSAAFHSVIESLISEPLSGPLQAETLIIMSPDTNHPLLCSTLTRMTYYHSYYLLLLPLFHVCLFMSVVFLSKSYAFILFN